MLNHGSKIKGIAIDIDSFPTINYDELIELDTIMECIFLTTDDDMERKLVAHFSNSSIYKINSFQKGFYPNKSTHKKVLDSLQINNTELAYLSYEHIFLENANQSF